MYHPVPVMPLREHGQCLKLTPWILPVPFLVQVYKYFVVVLIVVFLQIFWSTDECFSQIKNQKIHIKMLFALVYVLLFYFKNHKTLLMLNIKNASSFNSGWL